MRYWMQLQVLEVIHGVEGRAEVGPETTLTCIGSPSLRCVLLFCLQAPVAVVHMAVGASSSLWSASWGYVVTAVSVVVGGPHRAARTSLRGGEDVWVLVALEVYRETVDLLLVFIDDPVPQLLYLLVSQRFEAQFVVQLGMGIAVVHQPIQILQGQIVAAVCITGHGVLVALPAIGTLNATQVHGQTVSYLVLNVADQAVVVHSAVA